MDAAEKARQANEKHVLESFEPFVHAIELYNSLKLRNVSQLHEPMSSNCNTHSCVSAADDKLRFTEMYRYYTHPSFVKVLKRVDLLPFSLTVLPDE